MSAGFSGTNEEGESGITSKGNGAKFFFPRQKSLLKIVSGVAECEGGRERRLWNRNQTSSKKLLVSCGEGIMEGRGRLR